MREDIFIYYILAAVIASCFYVLFKFRFVREGTQEGTLVKPLKQCLFFIYVANYFIIFFKKKLLHKWLKDL
jgi:hypothetical protein